MDDTRPRSRSSRRYGNASKLKKGSNFGAGFEPKLLSGRQGLGNGHGLQGVIPQSDNSSAECGSDHSEPRTLIGVEVASSRGFSDSSSMETVPLKAQLVHISEEIGRLTGAQAAIQAVLKERSEVGSLRATLDAERSQWARQEEHLKSQLVHYEHEAKEKEALIQQLKSTLDAKSGHVLQLQQELAATQQLVEQRDTALRLREAAETQSAANLATVLDKLRGAEAQQAQQHEAYDRLAKQLADTEGALADKDAAFKEYEASMQESLQKWEKRVQEQDTWNWRMQQEMVGMDQHYQGEVMKIIQERDRLLQELHQARASAQVPTSKPVQPAAAANLPSTDILQSMFGGCKAAAQQPQQPQQHAQAQPGAMGGLDNLPHSSDVAQHGSLESMGSMDSRPRSSGLPAPGDHAQHAQQQILFGTSSSMFSSDEDSFSGAADRNGQGPVRSNGPPNGVVQFGSDGSRVVESGHRSVNPELERLLASAADPASMQQVAAVGSGSYLGSVSFFAGTQQGVTTNDTPVAPPSAFNPTAPVSRPPPTAYGPQASVAASAAATPAIPAPAAPPGAVESATSQGSSSAGVPQQLVRPQQEPQQRQPQLQAQPAAAGLATPGCGEVSRKRPSGPAPQPQQQAQHVQQPPPAGRHQQAPAGAKQPAPQQRLMQSTQSTPAAKPATVLVTPPAPSASYRQAVEAAARATAAPLPPSAQPAIATAAPAAGKPGPPGLDVRRTADPEQTSGPARQNSTEQPAKAPAQGAGSSALGSGGGRGRGRSSQVAKGSQNGPKSAPQASGVASQTQQANGGAQTGPQAHGQSQSAAQPTSEASASATANGRSQIGPGVQASSTSQSGQPRSPAKASAAAKASGTSNGVADKNAGRAPQSTPAAAKEVQHKGSTPSRPSSARENVADNGATAPQRAFRSRKRSGQAAAGAAQAQAVH